MFLPSLADFPRYPFPAGYRCRLMSPADVGLWVQIQQAAEPFLTMDESWFWKEFGEPRSLAWQRCLLLEEPGGNAIGTISGWTDEGFRRQEHGRLHWLAIHPDWQGRGLAKPLISAVLTLLAQHHDSAYLMTQIERQAAIHLYQKFGFEPVIDPPEPIAPNP